MTHELQQGQNLIRRQHILHKFEILAMIYKVMMTAYKDGSSNLFLDRLDRVFEQQYKEFGGAITSIFLVLISGEALHENHSAKAICRVIDEAVTLEMESWALLKEQLLNFLMNDAACKGIGDDVERRNGWYW